MTVRAGLFGALPPSLLVAAGAGLLATALAARAHPPTPTTATPLLVAGVAILGRVSGIPLHELLPDAALWHTRRALRDHHWLRRIGHRTGERPPGGLAGLTLADVARADGSRVGLA